MAKQYYCPDKSTDFNQEKEINLVDGDDNEVDNARGDDGGFDLT